jgi:hypothetical protein
MSGAPATAEHRAVRTGGSSEPARPARSPPTGKDSDAVMLAVKELPDRRTPRGDMGSCGHGGVNPAGMTDPQREKTDPAVMLAMVRRVRYAVKIPRTDLPRAFRTAHLG